MALTTNRDAFEVHTIIRWFAGKPAAGQPLPTLEQVLVALEHLADQANAKVMCGPSSKWVREHVPRRVTELAESLAFPVEEVLGRGRELATLVQDDIQACGNAPPHPDDCEDCQPHRDALLQWALAVGRYRKIQTFAFQDGERCCRVCGCTDVLACHGGCYWVEDPLGIGDLCSACVDCAV